MKVLHVYAGPFPTVQGTQALVDATCALLHEAGHEVHLLTYAHGSFSRTRPYAIHRVPDWPRLRSTRSGPSAQKIALDLRLAAQVRRLLAQLQPDLVHAHHYEALVACRLADPRRVRPLVFHCHALLGPELETYFPDWLALPARLVGHAADRTLPGLADALGAVTPQAVCVLERTCPNIPVSLLTPYVPEPEAADGGEPTRPERVRAVYLGNLDGYQDLSLLLDGLAALTPEIRSQLEVIIATDSDADQFGRNVKHRGLTELVRVIPHGSPGQAHALLRTAHVALVPRTTQGGAPIKLINALRAGVPVLADVNAANLLAHGEEAYLANMKDPVSVAQGLTELVRHRELQAKLSLGGMRVARDRWNDKRATRDLENLYSKTLNQHQRRQAP